MTKQRPEHSDIHKKKRRVNIALGLALCGMVVLFFVVTLVRIGGNIAEPRF